MSPDKLEELKAELRKSTHVANPDDPIVAALDHLIHTLDILEGEVRSVQDNLLPLLDYYDRLISYYYDGSDQMKEMIKQGKAVRASLAKLNPQGGK